MAFAQSSSGFAKPALTKRLLAMIATRATGDQMMGTESLDHGLLG
jgi:hypothetical protein